MKIPSWHPVIFSSSGVDEIAALYVYGQEKYKLNSVARLLRYGVMMMYV